MIVTGYYESPIGRIEVKVSERAVESMLFVDHGNSSVPPSDQHPLLVQAFAQLDEYFQGKRKEFTLPLETRGTAFQQNVWNNVAEVPYGQTCSYRDIAIKAGNEKAVRAVGSANGKNKILIAIPCHRVVGSNQKLTGYAGGLWRKEWLLNHEQGNV